MNTVMYWKVGIFNIWFLMKIGHIIYPTDGRIILKEEEWNKIKAGQTVTVNKK